MTALLHTDAGATTQHTPWLDKEKKHPLPSTGESDICCEPCGQRTALNPKEYNMYTNAAVTAAAASNTC
jgi:hypothetical protein